MKVVQDEAFLCRRSITGGFSYHSIRSLCYNVLCRICLQSHVAHVIIRAPLLADGQFIELSYG